MKLQAIRPISVTQSQQNKDQLSLQHQYKSKQISFGSGDLFQALTGGIIAGGCFTVIYGFAHFCNNAPKIIKKLRTILKNIKIK